MKLNLSVIAAVATLAFTSVRTHADLLLTGNLVGVFQPSANSHTVVTNSASGDASFRTGVVVGDSFQSGVVFNGASFANVASGDTLSLGMFSYYNGVTQIGTSSGSAILDLYLQLANPGLEWVHLTTLTFGIDATVNTLSSLTPDSYSAGFTQPAEVWNGDEWLKFSISGIPSTTSLAENTWANVGSVTLTAGTFAAPVSEKGASGLFLALGLVALFGCSRWPRRHGRSLSLPF